MGHICVDEQQAYIVVGRNLAATNLRYFVLIVCV
jgi:hypothetical protein